mmetsp:Transcript_7804/g.8588  ORF Transcript_7804/g.8588 Transcript_7804/m.8588 type:complete len:177 (-) Transcript_7804:896-1426(-)
MKVSNCFGFLLLSTICRTSSFVPTSQSHIRLMTSCGMFTGIVEEMGEVVRLEKRDDMTLWDGSTGKGTELTVKGDVVMDGAYLGCSICVNGVCLTATELTENSFKVGLAPETLRRTYLGDLKVGEPVNLERASEIGGRNSGHFVQVSLVLNWIVMLSTRSIYFQYFVVSLISFVIH